MEKALKYFESQMKDYSMKLAYFTDIEAVYSRYYSNETFIKLKEVLLTTQNGIIFPRNYFMFHLADKVIGPLIPSGILQHSHDYHFFYTEMKDKPEELGPQVFRVTDLSFGFVLWLLACGVCSIVFIVEWLIPRVKRLIRTAIGLVLFLRLLRQRLNVVY
jgi:hypothetical protein